ncbi:MAG: hypothetical protein FWF81_05570 [Defluviitaleaceae bacterium]|nr:hypothetical protein [Defluviitaleaceae bacterium]
MIKKLKCAGFVLFFTISTVLIASANSQGMQEMNGYPEFMYDIGVSSEEHKSIVVDEKCYIYDAERLAYLSQEYESANYYEAQHHFASYYPPGMRVIERTAELTSARELYAELMQLYEYLSQFGEAHLPDICDYMRHAIDTDAYIYMATFHLYFCEYTNILIPLDY